MKNKLLKITSVVLAIAFALSMVVYAEESDVITTVKSETPVAKIDFTSVEKENDVVELDVRVKDTAFIGIQVAIQYDSDILKPVNDSGDDANKFKDFATRDETAEIFNVIGTEWDAERSVVEFTAYIMPGTEGEHINDNFEYVAGSDGVSLYKFRFKKLLEKPYTFSVANKQNKKEPLLYITDRNHGVLLAEVFCVQDGVEVSSNEYDTIVKDPTSQTRKSDAIFMVISESAAFVNGKKTLIDSANKQVVPYIKNDRTLVPLRFVSESIGAEVLWEDGWDYCLIKKDAKEIKITFGSAEFEVNGEKFTYEAPIETVHDRTMVPVRFISEHLGYNVYWQELNQAVVITPENNPWIEDRNAEKTALIEVIVSIKGILP